MAITNIGSINIDNVYRVENFVAAGETLLVKGYSRGLGGKGANQSIAIARAGSIVRHVGAVGPDGAWTVDALSDAGIDTQAIQSVDEPTGHASIQVNDHAENSILVYSGANVALTNEQISGAVSTMQDGDWLLFQNETNLTQQIAEAGRARPIKIAYSAAPFMAEQVKPILPVVDLLVVNELEAASLADFLGVEVEHIPVPVLVVTRGAEGATYLARSNGADEDVCVTVLSFDVDAVDTTGAGDTFLGYLLSSLDTGMDVAGALRRASAAAAIQVSRPGAADAIPSSDEVDEFLAKNGSD